MEKGRNADEQRVIEIAFQKGQGHLFHFWEKLSEAEKDVLIAQVRGIDYRTVEEAHAHLRRPLEGKKDIEVPDVISVPETAAEVEKENRARRLGEEFLRGGGLAAFTAAGGQSSRLGLDIPKGAFPVTPVREKTLFQVIAEKIRFIQEKYEVRIPWIIMVSGTNNDQTVRFFREHDYFGLETEYVKFIEQGMFPALDDEGKILMKNRHSLFLNPTGHGGTFATLCDSGALDWLRSLGVEEIFYFQVDNVLIKVCDPVFIGHHRAHGCQMSSKAVRKENPKEKLGVFALEEGKVSVIEYSELEEVLENHETLSPESFTAGSIAIHLIRVDFALSFRCGAPKLPLHLAHKVIPHVDMQGREVKPEGPNGFKIETFIFDALKFASSSIIMEVRREEEFSPLKNRSGSDSPQTVLRDQLNYFARWFEKAGISVPRKPDGTPVHRIEVSPLFASFEEDFLKKIDRGLRIQGDTHVE
jgi:UDP-N-acetylglucosamine/UDP-N-acetylgalactosamine diphosphorylase